MSNEKVVRRVLFHANAVALAAQIQTPREYFLDAVACSCLPVTGGRAEAHAHYDRRGMFSYDSAFTSVIGQFVPPQAAAALELKGRNYDDNDLPAETILKGIVTGLRIDAPADPGKRCPRRILKVEYLEAEIKNFYDRRNPIVFRTLQVKIEGVSVDGKVLIVETNPQLFLQNDTWEKLDSAYCDDRQRYANQILYHNQEDGVTLGTVVTGLRWADGAPDGFAPTLPPGHSLAVEGLGTLNFGEIYVEEGLRRLTLLRVQLGSTNGGSASVVDCVSNTQTIPPR
jgi:hypothetical protein